MVDTKQRQHIQTLFYNLKHKNLCLRLDQTFLKQFCFFKTEKFESNENLVGLFPFHFIVKDIFNIFFQN